jgi:phosphoglycerol transferase MdoB-like AlkP superfamily enzyme
MHKTRKNNHFEWRLLIRLILIGLLISTIGRWLFIETFFQVSGANVSWFSVIYTSIINDLRTWLIVTSIIYPISLTGCLIPCLKKLMQWLIIVISSILLTSLIVLLIVSYFWYQNDQLPIGPVLLDYLMHLGISKSDAQYAISRYPWQQCLSLLILFNAAWIYWAMKLKNNASPKPSKYPSIRWLVMICLTSFIIFGQPKYMCRLARLFEKTPYPVINMALVHPFQMSLKAITEFSLTRTTTLDAVKSAYQATGLTKPFKADFWTATPKQQLLKTKPPHVAIVHMESMGLAWAAKNKWKPSALGSLATHVQSDNRFNHFYAYGRVTVASMEYLLIGSILSGNEASISGSDYRLNHFPQSAILPYKKSGYQTALLVGHKLKLNEFQFYHHIGFDQVDDAISLKPFSDQKTWDNVKQDVFDEVLFKVASKRLKQAKKPLLIYIVTHTNHPPYSYPHHFQPTTSPHIDWLAERFQSTTQKAKLIATAYQYSADCLGRFITYIKQWQPRTIVAAFGDHNFHGFIPEPQDQAIGQKVFFYLYAPPPYNKPIDYHRLASHKDIFPTLYHLSLSQARYLNMGTPPLAS